MFVNNINSNNILSLIFNIFNVTSIKYITVNKINIKEKILNKLFLLLEYYINFL